MAATAGESIISDVLDSQDLPLGVTVDEAEYARLLRRIGLVEGEAGTSVSAFNSSI
jgi:hypothetical protein